jgi:hypothetical protein
MRAGYQCERCVTPREPESAPGSVPGALWQGRSVVRWGQSMSATGRSMSATLGGHTLRRKSMFLKRLGVPPRMSATPTPPLVLLSRRAKDGPWCWVALAPAFGAERRLLLQPNGDTTKSPPRLADISSVASPCRSISWDRHWISPPVRHVIRGPRWQRLIQSPAIGRH